MTTVYCVFTGCYSDTTLLGTFSTKKNANLLIKKLKEEGSNIEYYAADARIVEYRLDELMDFVSNGYKSYNITMMFDTGDIVNFSTNPLQYARCDKSYWISGRDRDPRLISVNVVAKDEDTALKIAVDVRRMVLATRPDIKRGVGGKY